MSKSNEANKTNETKQEDTIVRDYMNGLAREPRNEAEAFSLVRWRYGLK